MEEHERREAGGGERRVTRRVAIAAGAGAYASSMLWGASSFAATSTPTQLLARLRHEIRSSTVGKQLKSSLLTTIGRAATELNRGHNAAARKTLQQDLIPALQRNSGHHGLSAKHAKQWVAEAEKVVSKIPGLGAGNGGRVYVFNCFNEPISGLAVAGRSVGTIPGWSDGGRDQTRYTPAGLAVPRARSTTPGQFAFGDNAVAIPWDSYTGVTTIKIPDPQSGVSLDDDLILFVAVNQATLQTTRGFVLATFKINPSG